MVVIPVYGVLMESLGRKVAMLTAGIFYGLGTILCATSGSMYQLIAARAVAGVSSPPIPPPSQLGQPIACLARD
jgi:MFS family permease